MSIWNPASWFNRKKPITVEENKAKMMIKLHLYLLEGFQNQML